MAHAAAQALRAVLRDIEVNEPPTGAPPRSLADLCAEVAAVNAACAACDYGILGQTVPNLVGELHTLAEANGSVEARRLLADVLHAAFYLSKDLGHGDLAWMVIRNTITLGEATFDKITTPTATQRRAFELIGAPIPLSLK
ncbi:MAG: hypothetical protein ACRDRR_20040 [Pseudonocardiaceae bacterium]